MAFLYKKNEHKSMYIKKRWKIQGFALIRAILYYFRELFLKFLFKTQDVQDELNEKPYLLTIFQNSKILTYFIVRKISKLN